MDNNSQAAFSQLGCFAYSKSIYWPHPLPDEVCGKRYSEMKYFGVTIIGLSPPPVSILSIVTHDYSFEGNDSLYSERFSCQLSESSFYKCETSCTIYFILTPSGLCYILYRNICSYSGGNRYEAGHFTCRCKFVLCIS